MDSIDTARELLRMDMSYNLISILKNIIKHYLQKLKFQGANNNEKDLFTKVTKSKIL